MGNPSPPLISCSKVGDYARSPGDWLRLSRSNDCFLSNRREREDIPGTIHWTLQQGNEGGFRLAALPLSLSACSLCDILELRPSTLGWGTESPGWQGLAMKTLSRPMGPPFQSALEDGQCLGWGCQGSTQRRVQGGTCEPTGHPQPAGV